MIGVVLQMIIFGVILKLQMTLALWVGGCLPKEIFLAFKMRLMVGGSILLFLVIALVTELIHFFFLPLVHEILMMEGYLVLVCKVVTGVAMGILQGVVQWVVRVFSSTTHLLILVMRLVLVVWVCLLGVSQSR
jgi:hypothetical protein